jgi:Skp family chaperone for outer membrane proteins
MVFSHRMALRFVILLIAVPLVMTGCIGKKQSQDTKAPVIEARLGIIDINKIVKVHPRYSEYQTLQLQINALNYQLEAKAVSSPNVASKPSEFQQAETLSGLNASRAIEINSKFAKKQNELQYQYTQKKQQAEQNVEDELRDYKKQLGKEYMLPLFNLDIKKKATLSQSDAAAVNDEIERLYKEQQEKLAAKKAVLESRRDQSISAEYERLQAEMMVYREKLEKEADELEQDKPAAGDNMMTPIAADVDSADTVKLTEQLLALQQKQALLEQDIMEDIQNKTGQIAAEKGLDTVITNIKVNIRALDITDLVIDGLKK